MRVSAGLGLRFPTGDSLTLGGFLPTRPGAMVVAVCGVLLLGLVTACGQSSSPSKAPDSTRMVDSGSWYSRQQWPHDGNPIESQNFIVYSDAASLDARQRLAELAEETLAELMAEMGIDPETMFRLPPDQVKIDLYANKNNLPDWGGPARGYYAGLIIMSFDHQVGEWPANEDFLGPILKHELVHVLESLLKGRFVGDIPVDDPRRMPVWFSEGMAEALSGGTSDLGVRSLDQIGELTAEYGQISPVTYKVDFPASEENNLKVFFYYYPMSRLAVEYLIDPEGHGKPPEDLTSIMVDMADDAAFSAAFEDHMGVSVADYEEQFFGLMNEYLPEGDPSSPVLPIGIALVVFAAAGFITWRIRTLRSRT